eukprot:COSAG02_NODE_4219_length_5616_cov_20.365779_2_plen_101_part_00
MWHPRDTIISIERKRLRIVPAIGTCINTGQVVHTTQQHKQKSQQWTFVLFSSFFLLTKALKVRDTFNMLRRLLNHQILKEHITGIHICCIAPIVHQSIHP